uniref:G-protein coupled receptors family 1 profile domain-containing protein n=1 Tax=Latimeria chalumnae TaxID=7897 RepID=H3B316_LATCH
MNNSTETSFPARNTSKPCDISDPVQFIIVPLVYTLVFCIGLPSNFIALVVFWEKGKKIKKAIRVYLINLTVADILFNLTLPLWIDYYFKGGKWNFPDIVCRLVGGTYYLTTYAAISFMTFISINRYLTVQMGKKRTKLFLNSQKGACYTCTVAWLFWICCAIPSLLEQQTFETQYASIKCFEHNSEHNNFAFASVGFFAVSFIVVVITYISLMRTLSTQGAQPGSHRKLAKSMVLGMLLVFVVCVAPYHFILAPWVKSRSLTFECASPGALTILHNLSIALLSLNSCIDPLIYCFSVKRFRTDLLKTSRKILRCLSFKIPIPDISDYNIRST